MTLFPEIDTDATKKKVHKLLNNYRRMVRLADEEYIPNITPTYSLQPRGGTFKSDQVSDMVTRKVTAQEELQKITRAINKLTLEHRMIIHGRYITKKRMTDDCIYAKLNISERTYYRELEKCLIEFAEAYDNGSLLTDKRQ